MKINLIPLLCLVPLVALLAGKGAGSGEEPRIPTEPPKPRAPPKTVKLKALHRYEIVADVLPVGDLESMALQAFPLLGFLGVEVLSAVKAPVKRNGYDVTRVTLRANMLVEKEYDLERESSYAGVGSIWLVSAKDIGNF